MVKLIELYREKGFGGNNKFKMREIYINPNHVVCMHEDISMKKSLLEGLLPQDLDKRQILHD